MADEPVEAEERSRASIVIEHLDAFLEAPQDDSAGRAEALHKAAALIEEEEASFRTQAPDIFSRDREGHPISGMVNVILRNEQLLQDIFSAAERRRDTVVQAAAGRFLVAAAPGLASKPTLQQSLFMELLTQDGVEDKLFAWAESEKLPMCAYGAGLLAFALLDDQCADDAVRRNLVPKLLRRLRGIVWEDESIFGAPGAKAVDESPNSSTAEPTGPELLKREKGYLVQCMTVLMSYKECLSCALQEGALDIVIELTRKSDKVLCFETLRMLAALLSHRKFSLVFLEAKGLKRLINLPHMGYCSSSAAMCLFSMCHFRGALLEMCRSQDPSPKDLCGFALRLLEYRDDAASSNTLQLFGKLVAYEEAFLRPFDALGGCRALLNVARYSIEPPGDEAPRSSKGKVNVAKWCAYAIRNFLRSHLLVAAAHLESESETSEKQSAVIPEPGKQQKKHQPVSPEAEEKVANATIVVERKGRVSDPEKLVSAVQELAGHGGLEMLLEMLKMASALRLPELAVYALQAMQVACIIPVVRMQLLESRIPGTETDGAPDKTGMRLLVDAAGGLLLPDGQVVCYALQVLCTCIGCSPPPLTGRALRHEKNDRTWGWGALGWEVYPPNATCRRVWAQVQDCDGIRVLSALLKGQEQEHQDGIRALACRALLGLSHEPRIRQILQETQLSLALTELVKQDSRARAAVKDVEAAAFRLAATKLISCVTGRAQHAVLDVAGDSALRKIEKAAMVEQATITYENKELLNLIHSHLQSCGLQAAAKVLSDEAGLDPPTHAPLASPERALRTPANTVQSQHRLNQAGIISPYFSPNRRKEASTAAVPQTPAAVPYREQNSLDNICKTYLRQLHSECRNPIKILPPLSLSHAPQGPGYQGPGIGAPRNNLYAPSNVAVRVLDRERRGGYTGPTLRHGGRGGASMTRQYIYSRFKPLPYRFSNSPDPAVQMSSLTTGCFFPSQASNWPVLLMGSREGTLSRFNVEAQMPVWDLHAHDESILSVCLSHQPGTLRVLTSTETEARIWDMESSDGTVSDHPLFELSECSNATFSHGHERIAGTASNGRTLLFDSESGQLQLTLQEPQAGTLPQRAQRHRRACFSPDDEMVLCDGVLWDPRCPAQCIHKFDRFAHYGGGSFHPTRPEVIISSAVWDVRMNFKLLRWVPSLDQMHTVFNASGDVMYGFLRYFEEDGARGPKRNVRKYKSMFRTVDAINYTDIATVHLKENVADVFVNDTDAMLAVMEVGKDQFGSSMGTTCKLYEVGRVKASASDDEDEEEEEEEEREDEDVLDEIAGEDGEEVIEMDGQFLNGGPQGMAMLAGLLGGESDDDDGSEGDFHTDVDAYSDVDFLDEAEMMDEDDDDMDPALLDGNMDD